MLRKHIFCSDRMRCLRYPSLTKQKDFTTHQRRASVFVPQVKPQKTLGVMTVMFFGFYTSYVPITTQVRFLCSSEDVNFLNSLKPNRPKEFPHHARLSLEMNRRCVFCIPLRNNAV